jgi:hypothetical protein
MEIPPINLNARLKERYGVLVEQHSTPTHPLASGLRALPGGGQAFAATQAAWRFFKNPKVTLPALCQPLQEHTRQQIETQGIDYLLLVHDWSWLDFNGHTRKKDRTNHSHERAKGYDLLTSLAVSGQTGAPIAPVFMALESAEGLYTSVNDKSQPAFANHQEGLLAQIAAVEALNLPANCVHIIDREADSVGNYRAFAAADHLFVIRAKEKQRAQVGDETVLLSALPARLGWTYARPVLYHGRSAAQYVAEIALVLTRPHVRKRAGKQETIHGTPVSLRLIASEVRSEAGKVLACWYLLTNVSETVPAETIALWYYWRWQIECYHKLLKSGGWQIEDWQQESASALVKRLAVVAMASALIWAIQHCRSPEAELLREELVRLSGRQMKRGRPVTAPALLAGLWTLLSAVDLLERYTPDQVRARAHQATGFNR